MATVEVMRNYFARFIGHEMMFMVFSIDFHGIFTNLSFIVSPDEWKIAKVTAIFKKGSKSDLNNYRPISAFPIVSKLCEKIIYQQLYDYLDKNKLLNAYQSGFRSLHSTMTALLETTNNWSINIDNGLLNCVVYIDLKRLLTPLTMQFCYVNLQTMDLISVPYDSLPPS